MISLTSLETSLRDGAALPRHSPTRTNRRLFKHLIGVQPNFEPGRTRPYFPCLIDLEVRQAFLCIEELAEGVDALELRVNLSKPGKSYETIGDLYYPVDLVCCRVGWTSAPGLPIVFTVRTKSQGRSFSDKVEKEALVMSNTGLRPGVEYLDVEIPPPEKAIQDLISKKGTSQIDITQVISQAKDKVQLFTTGRQPLCGIPTCAPSAPETSKPCSLVIIKRPTSTSQHRTHTPRILERSGGTRRRHS
ncbi:hypothetical protein EST38_g14021 [Candolleomyces aberdarensis]|uniref:Uncharacterized protein n=1 Tax=Candolleomyces aberdarensis TaxID=2316362 RepID=A0A4Q2CZI4_9AGAR|nr:hypothetical protein EST38_g14021 [Candolleomyces aberdarensis]